MHAYDKISQRLKGQFARRPVAGSGSIQLQKHPGQVQASTEGETAGNRLLLAGAGQGWMADLRSLLGGHWRVEVSRDGAAALAAAGHNPPEMVLIDADAPAPGGIELLRRLRAQPATSTLPILLLSAGGGEDVQAYEAGADDFLRLPVLEPELLARVRGRLELARLRRGTVYCQRPETLELTGGPVCSISFPEENPSPVLRASAEGKALYLNPAARQHPSFALEGEYLPEPLRALIGPALSQGQPTVHDVELAGGHVFSISLAPFPQERYVNLYCRDITERRQTEEELRASEEKYRSVFEQAAVGIGRVRFEDARWIDVNEAFCAMLGYSQQEMLRTAWPQITHREDLDLDLIPFRRMAAGELDQYTVEKRFIHKLGHEVWAKLTLSLVRDVQGRPLYEIAIIENIDKRKRAEEALRDSEERLRLAVESADLGVWELDIEKDVAFRSPRHDQIFGYSEPQEEWGLEVALRHVLPEDRPAIHAAYERASKTGVLDHESRVRWPDGSIHWFHAYGRFYTNSEGRPVRIAGLLEDITERKRAEEAQRQSEERLRLLVESSPDNMFAQDAELRYVWVYNPVEPLTVEGMIGKTDFDLLPREEAERLTAIKRRVLETGERQRVELQISPGSMNRRWYDATYEPQKDAEGRVVGLFGYVRDITQLKQSELALGERESFYRQTLESIPGMVFTTRPDGYCDYQSQQWVDFTGVPMTEMLGTDWNKLLHPDDRARAMAAWEGAVHRQQPYELEYRVRRRDGAYEWFRVIGRPIHDSEGNISRWFGVAANIDKLKQIEEDLRRLNERLEQLVGERTRQVRQQADRLRALASELSRVEQRERKRLATILHDHIQQLMVAARMQLGWIKPHIEVERMISAAQGADEILREALDASRSLTFDLSPPVLHDSGLVGGLNWLANRMRQKHHFEVWLRLDHKAEPATEEIRFLLFECVRELLFNASKHAGVPDGELVLSRMGEDRLRIVITDKGKGFDPRQLENRQPSELTFGLFSIQERLAYIGGSMVIEASAGQGTRIILTAPIGTADVPTPGSARPQPAPPSRKISTHNKSDLCRVLIVDDHKIMREGLVHMLQFEPGIEVVGEAADGHQAIEMAVQLNPDVIIMDVNLAGMNGIEASRRILAQNPRIKVIGLSMHLDSNIAEAMREAGATHYFSKGGASEEMIAAIRACRVDDHEAETCHRDE